MGPIGDVMRNPNPGVTSTLRHRWKLLTLGTGSTPAPPSTNGTYWRSLGEERIPDPQLGVEHEQRVAAHRHPFESGWSSDRLSTYVDRLGRGVSAIGVTVNLSRSTR